MKKLLPVMALVLCACLSMGFTAPDKNTSYSTTNGPKLRPAFAKWRNTTWINPMAAAKQLPVKFKVGSAYIIINNKTFGNYDQLISATFTENYTVHNIAGRGFSYYMPYDTWKCKFNLQVDPSWYLFATITERNVNVDPNAHYIYYEDYLTTANYEWYPKALHEYVIEFEF